MGGGVKDAGLELQRHFQQFLGLLLQARVHRRRQPRRKQTAVLDSVHDVAGPGEQLSHLHRVRQPRDRQHLPACILLGHHDGVGPLGVAAGGVGQGIGQQMQDPAGYRGERLPAQ